MESMYGLSTKKEVAVERWLLVKVQLYIIMVSGIVNSDVYKYM